MTSCVEPGRQPVANLGPLGEQSAAAFERRLELVDQDRGVADHLGVSLGFLSPAIGPVRRPDRASVVVFRLLVEEVVHQAIDPPDLRSRLILGNLGNLLGEPGPLMKIRTVKLPGDRHELLDQVIAELTGRLHLPFPGDPSMLEHVGILMRQDDGLGREPMRDGVLTDAFFPASDFGPELLRAFFRLASTCFCVATMQAPK